MRFHVNQNLFAVHFGYNVNVPRTYGFYSQPMLWDNIEPDDINFVKLTVTEHHKVPDAHAPDTEAKYDGYLLKNDAGQVFANQYPHASYGQTSDEGNRRFAVHITKSGELDKLQEENEKAVFEYYLLSDVLEKIQRGIKDLGEIPATEARYQQCIEKRDLLQNFYNRIVKEFGEKYPDYQLYLEWKPPFKKSVLIWPKVTFHKRISPAKAHEMSKEDIMRDFMSDGCFEIQYADGDRLIIENAEGSYYIDGANREVKTINVYYGEKSEEDGKPVFYVHQTEYFPHTWFSAAVDCFLARFNGGASKATGAGMSLEAITARNKEPEGIVQART